MFEHAELLTWLAKTMRIQVYLELGVQFGYTLRKVAASMPAHGLAIGVDKASASTIEGPPGQAAIHIHGMTTEEFFRENQTLPAVDLAFIDADHSWEAVERDFHMTWPHVREHGVIALHDTYPENADATSPNLCGTAWEQAMRLHLQRYEAFTLPVPPGITLVRKAKKHLPWM